MKRVKKVFTVINIITIILLILAVFMIYKNIAGYAVSGSADIIYDYTIITRSMPDVVQLDKEFQVNLDIKTPHVSALGISEYFPTDWNVTSVSEQGIIKEGEIEWLFAPGKSQTAWYKIIPKNNENDFYGGWYSTEIGGEIEGASQTIVVETIEPVEKWINPVSAVAYRKTNCNPENVLIGDDKFAGLGRKSTEILYYIDGKGLSSCIKVDFGQAYNFNEVKVKAKSVQTTCGDSCSGSYCGTSGAGYVFYSADGKSWKYIFGISRSTSVKWTNKVISGSARYILICRDGASTNRDNLEVDNVQMKVKGS